MTVRCDAITTSTLDSSSTLNIGTVSGSSSVILGQNANKVNTTNLTTNSIKLKVIYIDTQSYSPSSSDFVTNGTFFCFTYSSANPSTVNDTITINLPAPTASQLGMTFYFRKLRGGISNSARNYTVNCSSAIIGPTTGANITGVPLSTLNSNALSLRLLVCEYLSNYYWTFV